MAYPARQSIFSGLDMEMTDHDETFLRHMMTWEKEEMTEIDLKRTDIHFKHEVARQRGAENIKWCYACGACSARCPVGDVYDAFDPRRLIRMIILGMKDEVLKSPMIWYCSTCFTCQETCPQGVNFTDVLFALKNMAAKAGYFPAPMTAQADLLRDHGRLYEITAFENEKRAGLGLPELPECPEHFQQILEGFKLEQKEED